MLDHRLNGAVEPEAKVSRTWTWIASPRLGGRNHGMHVKLPVAENDRRIVEIACFEFSQPNNLALKKIGVEPNGRRDVVRHKHEMVHSAGHAHGHPTPPLVVIRTPPWRPDRAVPARSGL